MILWKCSKLLAASGQSGIHIQEKLFLLQLLLSLDKSKLVEFLAILCYAEKQIAKWKSPFFLVSPIPSFCHASKGNGMSSFTD